MKKINKKKPPFFKQFIAENNPKTWSDCLPMARRLRKHMLSNEQHEQCAYCEQAITPEGDKSHIDHFRRKAGHLFPELEFVYNNLYVSCISDEHCGRFKDSKLTSKEEFNNLIDPAVDDPREFFSFATTGEILPQNGKADFSICKFNLNHSNIKRNRKVTIKQLATYKNQLTIEEAKGALKKFDGMIDYIWEYLETNP